MSEQLVYQHGFLPNLCQWMLTTSSRYLSRVRPVQCLNGQSRNLSLVNCQIRASPSGSKIRNATIMTPKMRCSSADSSEAPPALPNKSSDLMFSTIGIRRTNDAPRHAPFTVPRPPLHATHMPQIGNTTSTDS